MAASATLLAVADGEAAPDVASQIAAARRDAKLTQRALGELAGVLGQEISRYERGETVPPVDRVMRIARATRRPLAFFYGEGAPAVEEEEEPGRALVGAVRDELREFRLSLTDDLRAALREELARHRELLLPR